MIVEINDDLAERIISIADNNGITIKGYVNSLMEKALSIEDRYAPIERRGERAPRALVQGFEVHIIERAPEKSLIQYRSGLKCWTRNINIKELG